MNEIELRELLDEYETIGLIAKGYIKHDMGIEKTQEIRSNIFQKILKEI